MLPSPADREASSGGRPPPYLRRRPERTLLYQLVEEYYPAFEAHLVAQGRDLPGYVRQECDVYLKCGRLEHGFLRALRHLSCRASRFLRASRVARFSRCRRCWRVTRPSMAASVS